MKRTILALAAAAAAGLALAPQASAIPVGGGAELGCVGDGLDACDIKFTVTKVEQNVVCDDPNHPLGPDGQWLRFDIDFDRQHARTSTSSAFLIGNWRVSTSDSGGMRVVLSEKCSTLPSPLLQPMDIGNYSKTAVVIAPKNAHSLVLYSPEGGSWRWNF